MAARPGNISLAERAICATDREIAATAAQKLGLVTRNELLRVGLSPAGIGRRLGRTLHRQHAGVYLHGHPRPAPGAKELAAALATDGVVSDRSAAGLWCLLPPWPGDVHVTVAPERKRRSRNGIVVHRRAMQPDEIHHLGPIPVTSPLRTIHDLPKPLRERATNEALVRRLIAPSDIQTPRRVTRSHAERRLLALMERAGAAPDATNVRLHGHEVDMLWRATRLVVEVDGHASHATPARFEHDHRRDQDLGEAGYRVLRVTWRQIRDEPRRVAGLIRRAAARA